MARKLKPHEERAFFEAAPLIGLNFSTEGSHAGHFHNGMDHPLFDKQPPALAHVELLFDIDPGQDEWF